MKIKIDVPTLELKAQTKSNPNQFEKSDSEATGAMMARHTSVGGPSSIGNGKTSERFQNNLRLIEKEDYNSNRV